MRKQFSLFILALLMAGCTAKPAEPPSKENAHENDAVKIAGTVFTKQDLSFYTIMEKIFIERDRLNSAQTASSQNNEYWEKQLAQYDNVNVQLQTVIELNAMALLAKEKGFYAHPDKIEENVTKVRQLISLQPSIKELAGQYEGNDFDSALFLYMEKYVLKQRIIKEIEKDVHAEKPNAAEAEIIYETGQRYEDLYEDQVSGLDLEIYLK